MILHHSVLQLSKRIKLFVPIPLCVASSTYLLSLSHCFYPGYSASLSAAAAGVIGPTDAAHPLFSLATCAIAALPVLSLPVRLNLFSALCGTLCAMLLFQIVSLIILFSACEDAGGGGREDLSEDSDEGEETLAMPPEVDLYNQSVLRIAIAGGLVAALLFTFTAPVWAAATRLDNGLFNLMLALASLNLFSSMYRFSRVSALALSVLLFVLGLFESAVFLLLLPCYSFFVFRAFWLGSRRITAVFMSLVAGLAGVALSTFACLRNTDNPNSANLPELMMAFARGLLSHHYHEIVSFFPREGWVLILLQVGLPALILLFGKQTLFKEKRIGTIVTLLVVSLAVAPGLLNLTISPYSLFQRLNHLPVFGYAVLVVAAAVAIAGGLLIISKDALEQDSEDVPEHWVDSQQGRRSLRGLAGILLSALVLLGVATPWRSFHEVDPRRGAFADEIAREMLDMMKERTWLITNGMLENHLRLQALVRERPLVLVSLLPQDHPWGRERLKAIISSSPVFEGQNRQRLQNALSIAPARFVMEWFAMDPKAESRAMVFAVSDIWTACGRRAVPEGLAFGGVLPEQSLDLDSLVEENRRFIDRIGPFLDDQRCVSSNVASLREALRMKAGFAVNELGVLLEDAKQFEEAYQTYAHACQIDPHNVSAMINGYAVASMQKTHPDSLDKMKKKIAEAMGNRVLQGQEITWILQNYGTIRQPAFYQQQATMWSSAGSRAVSAEKIRKALALSAQTGVAALVGNALVYVSTGDPIKAESCYLAALEKDGANKEALSGICTLMLSKRNMQEAERWLHKAAAAGIEKDALLYQTITLAIFKGEIDQALDLLKEATVKFPMDLRYWTLQADIFLKRGDIKIVEHTVLPEMQKAIKNPDHYMLHVVRGVLLRKKGPSHFREARIALLMALSRNAALPEIWNIVLELDMALGNKDFVEVDARNLLKIDPEHALANYLTGALLLSRGALPASEDFLRRSIGKVPTAAACNDLGDCLRLQGNLTEAERYARQSLAIDPKFIPALDTLANILFDSGNYNEASKLASKAVDAKPDRVAYQLTLLRAQIKQGDKEGVHQRLKSLDDAQASIPETLQREIKAMK